MNQEKAWIAVSMSEKLEFKVKKCNKTRIY